jgi:hypothetical protein
MLVRWGGAIEAEDGVPAETVDAIPREPQAEGDDEGEPNVMTALVDKLVGVPQAAEDVYPTAELGQRLGHAGDRGGARLKREKSRILNLLKSSRF